jgi:hypothetical protein
MKKSILFVFILLLAGFSTLSFINNSFDKEGDKTKKYDLKYNLQKGSKFTVTFVDEFERSTVLPDGDQTGNTIDDTYEGVFEVISTENNKSVDFKLQLKQASRISRNPGGTFNTNFEDIIGKDISCSISLYGKLLEFKMLDINLERNKLLGRTAPDDYLHRICTLFPRLPDKPVEVGDSWTAKVEEDYPAYGGAKSKITADYSYKILEEIEKDGMECLKIEVNYAQHTFSEGERRGRQFKYEMKGEGKEIIYFAYKEGVFIYKKGEYNPDGGFNNSAMSDTVEYEVKVTIQ